MPNSLTINLPDALYERIKQRAITNNRAVEEEVVEVMANAVPIETELSDDMQAAIANLKSLNDKALWKAARSHLPVKSANQIKKLHLKQQSEDLTEAEQQVLAELMHEYEKSILVRAHATGLLMERGYDVTVPRLATQKKE